MTQTRINRKKKDADTAYSAISNLVNKYGMQLILRSLIHHNDIAISGAQLFGLADDYLLDLKVNLEKALEEYKDRHEEFGK